MLLQSATPFFSNDQWGLLRVLGLVVGPIIATIWVTLWAVARRQEKFDINAIGTRINTVAEEQAKDRGRLVALEERVQEDRLAYMSALFAAEKALTAELMAIRVAIGRIEERTCTGGEMKDAIVEGVRMAMRELKAHS